MRTKSPMSEQKPRARHKPGRRRTTKVASKQPRRMNGEASTSIQAKALSGNRFVPLVQTVKREVDTRLLGLLDAKLDAAAALGPGVAEMVGALRALSTRGGKRLRAALVVAGFRCTDAEASMDPALDAGVAVELLQSYFLIHDDWIDEDDVRRGGPSVHALLGKRLRSRKRGNAAAILTGDYASALALEALARVETEPARTAQLLTAFYQMQTDAILGQQLDLVGNGKDVELAYKLKTGSYTVSGPLRMGALLGGASPTLLTTLERYAIPAGIAFQLRDDLLDLFGSPDRTGKPKGSDLRSGKRTPLLGAAFERLSPAQRKPVEAVLGDRNATEGQVQRAIDAIEKSGACDAMEARIAELAREATQALRGANITSEGSELLKGAVSSLTERRG